MLGTHYPGAVIAKPWPAIKAANMSPEHREQLEREVRLELLELEFRELRDKRRVPRGG